MEKTKILTKRGIELMIRYEHEEAEAQTRDYPGRGENVEILTIQLISPDADILELLDDCKVEEIIEDLLKIEKEERLERAR